MSSVRTDSFKSANELSEPVREALTATLLSLADNKRILGMRYGEWILGAPTLESGIACSAMAQDEWGHGRILYATLKDFGLDSGILEHERSAEEYLSSELLDSAVEEYRKAEALLPGESEPLFWHAVTLASVGRIDESLPLFAESFELRPEWKELVPRLPAAELLPDDPDLVQKIVETGGT